LTSRPVAADALPAGSRIASFEIEAVIARGPSSFVYLARDMTRGMPVAIKEYAPARRMGATPHEAADPLVQRGLQAFMAEARMLAACHHPSLVRVEALLDANGTAYRVMPFYKGFSLLHVRTGLGRAPDDATMRAWGRDLEGALQAMHDSGHAHGGVSPENIMLLADDRPLLFGAGSASHRVGSDLVESLLADFGLGGAAATARDAPDPRLLSFAQSGTALAGDAPALSVAPAEAVADDKRALAAVLRFCVSGEPMSSAPTSDTAAPVVSDAPTAASASPQAPPERSPDPAAELPSPVRLRAEDAPLSGAGHVGASVHPVASTASGADLALDPQPWTDAGSAAAASSIKPVLASRPLIPQRWHIPLWVGLIALLGVAVVAVMGQVMGAWNRIPPIAFDRSVQSAPMLESAPAASQTTPAASAPAKSEVAAPSSALLSGPRRAPAAGASATTQAKVNTNAAPRVVKPLAKKARKRMPPTRPARRAQPAVAVQRGSPQAACGARTNFALERCIQNQCQNKKWATHPQCTSRRAR
jgi:hypothetical protein